VVTPVHYSSNLKAAVVLHMLTQLYYIVSRVVLRMNFLMNQAKAWMRKKKKCMMH
jgi:hypothetical protein